MIVFGGYKNFKVKSLDLNSWNWTTVGELTFERFEHSANLIESKLFLFGGFDKNFKPCNDLFRYDVDSFALEKLKPKG